MAKERQKHEFEGVGLEQYKCKHCHAILKGMLAFDDEWPHWGYCDEWQGERDPNYTASSGILLYEWR